MYLCRDCNKESENAKGWYAELLFEGRDKKIMRCPDCGKKEEDKRYEMHFGHRGKRKSLDNVDKQNRIQYAKDLREAGLSWNYRENLTEDLDSQIRSNMKKLKPGETFTLEDIKQ